MKNVFLALALLALCKLTWAQEPVKHMLSVSLEHSKNVDYQKMKYLPTNYYGSGNPLLGIYYKSEKPRFNYYEVPIGYIIDGNKGYFFVSELSIYKSEYRSTYEFYLHTDYDNRYKSIENVDGNGWYFSFGLGKGFYLTDSKKILLIPMLESYLSGFDYVGEKGVFHNSVSNPLPERIDGSDFGFGLVASLNVNFQVSKHFGLGLKFRNLATYDNRSYNTNTSSIEIIEVFNYNFKQTPQLFLIYYFNTNNPNLF